MRVQKKHIPYMKGLVIVFVIDLKDLARGQKEKLFHICLVVKG